MKFIEYIKDPDTITEASLPQLREIVERHPWFYLAKLMLVKSCDPQTNEYKIIKESIDLRLSSYPAPKIMTYNLGNNVFKKFESFQIIDTFLSADFVSLPPIQQSDNKDDMSEKSSSFSDDLISESLAKVQIKQGHPGKARDIYNKLSLKYPEKSAYFAELIAKIDNNSINS